MGSIYNEGDYSSIMQDDGINPILRYTHQAYIATVMKATNAIILWKLVYCFFYFFCMKKLYLGTKKFYAIWEKVMVLYV